MPPPGAIRMAAEYGHPPPLQAEPLSQPLISPPTTLQRRAPPPVGGLPGAGLASSPQQLEEQLIAMGFQGPQVRPA